MIDIAVAIPTYNGADKIPKVFEKLQQQTGLENITWEIIVIDNNSSDETPKVVKEYQDNNFLCVELKYHFESQQGASSARQRAVKEVKGELIAFLDDDNFPEKNWLAEAVIFAKKHPQAGAYSGKIIGKYETSPPENFKAISQHLAIRNHGEKELLFQPDNLQLPPSAGLVVRKEVWLKNVPNNLKLTGPFGKRRCSGDDYEVLLYLHNAGWEIWYNPKMKIEHYIPTSRLEKEYLLALAMGNGLATCQLRMIKAKFWQIPIIFMKTFLGNLRRVFRQYTKYQKELKTNLIAEFELIFYWGSFLGCFYWLQRELNFINRIKSQ
ncbi:MAG: hormogonium polysaccharide biosynthesis glycosyltransferase HpsE [Trichodesmium sp. MAG_R04]|nr:hormogonium polysaccharide biosynthesis glycosyltransferase HpsE [Trichodesmium sp. MAG_R04]